MSAKLCHPIPQVLIVLLAAYMASAQQNPYEGVLVGKATVLLPPGFTAQLSAAQKEQLADEGFQIDDQHDRLIGSQFGLPGYWVRVVGFDQWFMTDRQGHFRMPDLPPDAKTLGFYRQLSDADPQFTFPIIHEGSPPTYLFEMLVPIPDEMNGETTIGEEPLANACSRLGTPPGCEVQSGKCVTSKDGCECRCNADGPAAKNNSSPGCCQDYNGWGDDLPRSRHSSNKECLAKAYFNFEHSTCAEWVISGECYNEAVIQCKPPWLFLDDNATKCAKPTNSPGGFKDCWHNHKYRNCQNMRMDDFSITPNQNIKIAPLTTVTLHVRNNTVSNDTMVSVSDGMLRLATSGPKMVSQGASSWDLQHYNDTQMKHYEDVDLRFTAPKLPKGVCSKTVNLRALSSGHTIEAEIDVSDPKCNTCPTSSLQLGLLSNDQHCPTPSVLGTMVPDVVCSPDGWHAHSLVLAFYNDKITCNEWDLNSCTLIADQKWLVVSLVNTGPSPQPPIAPGTYTLPTVPGSGGGQIVTAIPFTTDSTCHLSGHESSESGTITLISISDTAISGQIDAVVNGVPYTGSFTSAVCSPPSNPCATGCTGHVTCLPPPAGTLTSLK